MQGLLDNIYKLRDVNSFRVSSYEKNGGNKDSIVVKTGEIATIADIEGPGIIKHIWMTFRSEDPAIRRSAILRMNWDNEVNPSVESPIGDFFGQGWGESYNFASLPIASAPSGGRSLNCYFPMPFKSHATVVIDNQSDYDINPLYFCIDFQKFSEFDENCGYFHAWWNRELTDPDPDGENEWETLGPVKLHPSDDGNYIFADIEGKGHFIGLNYFVDNPGPIWYGEGDDMWMVDGEKWPGSLHGTGTEDFFNCAWCPNELFMHPYFGYARVPNKIGWMGRTHCYRYFFEDPVFFNKSLLASMEHGHANNLTLDLCSVAYWYQTEPHKVFPRITSKDLRMNIPEIKIQDIHKWRDAWRKGKGSGKLWGNEP